MGEGNFLKVISLFIERERIYLLRESCFILWVWGGRFIVGGLGGKMFVNYLFIRWEREICFTGKRVKIYILGGGKIFLLFYSLFVSVLINLYKKI